MATVIDINGEYQAILHRLQNMHGNVEVGIFDDGKKEPNKTSVYDVAVYNEFGTSHIPARPFMRQTSTTMSRSGRIWLRSSRIVWQTA